MSEYAYRFTIKEMPTSDDLANQLSDEMGEKYGLEGFQLFAVTPIPNSNPPGLLLSFQKELEPD